MAWITVHHFLRCPYYFYCYVLHHLLCEYCLRMKVGYCLSVAFSSLVEFLKLSYLNITIVSAVTLVFQPFHNLKLIVYMI